MRRFLLALALAAALPAMRSDAADRIEVILDVSGSMRGEAGGRRKIDSAREAVAETLAGVPAGAQVALRLYGHRLEREPKDASCRDTELVIPFGPIDITRFRSVLAAADPRGQTPLAYSMREAASDFRAGEAAVVILVSDGEETCGEDPIAAARGLLDQGVDLTVHTVGFDVDDAAREQLEGVSRVTGGQFKSARDARELSESLAALAREALLVEKVHSTYGDPIRGGDSFESAVALEVDHLYHLDHHQRQNQYDYFFVPMRAGQEIVATVETGERGVQIRGDDFRENSDPYAGIQLHAGRGHYLGATEIIGKVNASQSVLAHWGHGQPDRIYVLAGSAMNDQHLESRFHVTLRDRFDAGSGTDAGSDEATALDLEPGVYEENHLFTPEDGRDVFRLRARPGDRFELKARPEARTARLYLEVTDADGLRLLKADAPNDGAAARGEFAVGTGGDVFVLVSSIYNIDTAYRFEVQRHGGEEPAATDAGGAAAETGPRASTTAAPVETRAAGAADLAAVRDSIAGLGIIDKARLYLELSGVPFAVGVVFGFAWAWIRGRRHG